MATALDLIKGALKDIGILDPSEVPSASEAADGLTALNQMLGSWSNESLIAYDRAHEKFTLTAGQQSRTIGPTGDFVTARPLEIEVAQIEYQNSSPLTEFPPLKILTREQWAGIAQKDIQSDVSTMLFYEPTFPNGTIYLYPVPSVANKLVLTTRKALTAISSLTTAISLPPGWDMAIQKNLALLLAPSYRREPSQLLLMQAQESKAAIENTNATLNPRLMQCDVGVVRTGRYNIYTGGR